MNESVRAQFNNIPCLRFQIAKRQLTFLGKNVRNHDSQIPTQLLTVWCDHPQRYGGTLQTNKNDLPKKPNSFFPPPPATVASRRGQTLLLTVPIGTISFHSLVPKRQIGMATCHTRKPPLLLHGIILAQIQLHHVTSTFPRLPPRLLPPPFRPQYTPQIGSTSAISATVVIIVDRK